MRAIKGRDTKPELRLEAALLLLGVRRFTRPPKTTKANGGLPGSPDIVFAGRRLAVVVHGCFWHCCPRHFKAPASGVGGGAEGWRRKFADNVRRDRRVRRRLNRLGWRTMIVWEHEGALQAAWRVRAALGRQARALAAASRPEPPAQPVTAFGSDSREGACE